MRILIVDDESEVREALKAYIQHRFPWAELLEAENGRAARDILRRCLAERRVLDAFVLDIALRRDGQPGEPFDLALCEEAKGIYPFSLVMHYSAYTESTEVRAHIERWSLSFGGHDRVVDKSPRGAKSICDMIQAYNDLRIRFLVRFLFGDARGIVLPMLIDQSDTESVATDKEALLAEVTASYKALSLDTRTVIKEYSLELK